MKKNLMTLLLLFCTLICTANTLTGVVMDGSMNEPLIGATIQLKGTSIGTVTNFDGEFEIPNLQAGEYTLIISYVSFLTQEIRVSVPQKNALQVRLQSDDLQLGEVTVSARKSREGELVLQQERKASTLAIENMGTQEMKTKGISNVEEGVKKITGISIASAGQLIVRGLGDRYSITTLNGLAIASPNPDNKLVPLNLFPASTVQNITVSKVYDVASFADYSGAHINISTKDNIMEDFLDISLSTGGAFNTIGQKRYQMDRHGSLFSTPRMSQEVLDMPLIDFDNYAQTHNIFNTSFAVRERIALPTLGGNISMGKNFRIGNQTLSVLASLNMSNDYQNVTNAFYKTLEATGNVQSNFSYNSYEQLFKIAALGYVGYTLRESDRIGYTFFYARNASDTYQLRQGVDAEGHQLTGSNNVTHIYALQNHQLNGVHHFLGKQLQLDWGVSFGKTGSYEPDRRQVMYIHEDDQIKLFKLNRQETMRYFGALNETEWNGSISLQWNWKEQNALKAGINYKNKQRDYMGTRFYYNLNRLNPTIDDVFATDDFLNFENVEQGNIIIERKKQPKDSYMAGTEIIAGYVNVDYYPVEQLLINVGLRYEHSEQKVLYASDGGNWYGKQRDLDTDDLFPALNIKYAINAGNILRFAASRTVTRPLFVEMAPFMYQESYGSAQIRGNENLQNGYNYNIDLRYELFGKNGDMLSATGYFKYLENPIERIQELNGGATLHSFRNADNGIATGAEVEVRKQIVRDLKIGANASYMYTNVKLPEGGAYTNKERALQGASPILVNADITYSPTFNEKHALNLALIYNLQGSRIHAVGVSQLGDIKQQAVHTLNFNAIYCFDRRWTVKLQVNDLLGRDLVFVQEVPATGESIEVERYKYGSNFEVGVSYKL